MADIATKIESKAKKKKWSGISKTDGKEEGGKEEKTKRRERERDRRGED